MVKIVAIVALFACVALALAAEPAKKDAAASSDLQTANSFYGGYGLGYGLGYGGYGYPGFYGGYGGYGGYGYRGFGYPGFYGGYGFYG
ncbi:keratin-associated protein 19-2 [Folsomia candida]|uniref:keratin-associated protein 19-2 n=1 Tax=Folsomia candida TaxID=158441 RepID=UPI000B906F4E|nr:keratin-associated protein 19-2 [Folsomia candida]